MPVCVALVIAAALTAVGRAQSADAQARARATAFFDALAGDSAATFEAMARENYTPAHLARTSAERRQAMFDRVHADFGRLTLTTMEVQATKVVLTFRGATGFEATVEMDIEPTAPYRIVGYMMRVDDRPSPVAPPPINGGMSGRELGQAIDAYFAPLVADDKFAGVVLIAKDGSPLIEKAYGAADRGAKLPIAGRTRFNLGSINKIFTKTAIARLVSAGKLALSDTVGTLLPDYPNAQARGATVLQLLDHKAGIVDFFGPDFASTPKTHFRSNADYYRFVAPKPLLFAPGEKTQYCNGCYIVLGAIIERAAGMPYERYIAEQIFEPAGMKSAGFFQSDRFPDDVAIGYTRRAPGSKDQLQTNTNLIGAAGSAAGGAYAAAADLLAFDSALRDGRLLDPRMTAWILDGSVEAAKGPRARGMLGIAGGAPGLNALLESDGTWTVVVLANLDPPAAEQIGVAIARQLRR